MLGEIKSFFVLRSQASSSSEREKVKDYGWCHGDPNKAMVMIEMKL